MLFFQLDFLVLFLPALLAGAIVLKSFGPEGSAVWLASAASLLFLYEFSGVSVLIAAVSILLNYSGSRFLMKNRDWRVFAAIVILNLLLLAYFKYSLALFGRPGDDGSGWLWRSALPLGISFYTFQQIAFVSDVRNGKIEAFDLRTYSLFKLFFPQFIAGPITHFNRVEASYRRWPSFNARSLRYGALLFLLGMLKKLAGDEFGAVTTHHLAGGAPVDASSAWIAALGFTFQIYFDFSGYSDMALGLARMFGVSLPFNFNSPYKAESLRAFWRRWHITLSNWLRDYLYIGLLGGSRHGKLATLGVLMATMILGGLWHGAGLAFLAWGAFHGLGLVFTRVMRVSLPVWAGRSFTFLFVVLGWVLFRASSLPAAVDWYCAMFGLAGTPAAPVLQPDSPLRDAGLCLAAGLSCFFLPNSQKIALSASARGVRKFRHLEISLLLFAIVMISLAFISPDPLNAFIYFEF